MHTLTKKTEKSKTQDQGTKLFNLFLRITPDVRKGLRLIAAERDCSMQQAGMVAIAEFVERNRK